MWVGGGWVRHMSLRLNHSARRSVSLRLNHHSPFMLATCKEQLVETSLPNARMNKSFTNADAVNALGLIS